MKIYHQFLKMMKRLVEERHGPVWGVQPSIFDGDDKVMMVEMMNFFRCNSEKKKDSRSCCF
jgi:hypothetical protein